MTPRGSVSTAWERRQSWGYALGLAVLALLLVRSVFVVPYLPTNDGPEHVIASHIEDHFSDPGTIYADVLRPTTEFASHGFGLEFGPLNDLLGWRAGLQWTLAIIVLTYAAGFAVLVHAVNPARAPLAFLGFPLALTWDLYMGFFPFMVGSGLGLFVLALALRWREPTRVQRGVLAMMLLFEAICHVFSAVLTGVVLAIVLVWRASSEKGVRAGLQECGRVVLIGVPAAGVLAASMALVGRTSTFARDYVFLPLAENALVYPRFIAPGPWWRTCMVLAVLALSIAFAASRVFRRDVDVTHRALWVTGVLFLAGGAVAPINVPGWQFFSPRFLPLGALLVLATVPIEELARPGQRAAYVALSGGLFALALVWVEESSALHRRLAAACDDAILALSAPVQRRRIWLPITLAPEGRLSPYPELSEVPFLLPLKHFPSLFAVTEGGLPPDTFANSGATYPFVVRPSTGFIPPAPSPEEFAPLIESDAFGVDLNLRRRVVDRLARYGMRYEGILVTEARPVDLAVVVARGYVADWAERTVFIGHFVPCPLDVVIPSHGEVPRMDVSMGEGEAEPEVLRYRKLPAAEGPDGARHILVPDAPCGAVRVRPHWDAATESGATKTLFCTNAGPSGDLPATLTWTSARVVCERTNLMPDPEPAREASP